jgi:hypothetical protein
MGLQQRIADRHVSVAHYWRCRKQYPDGRASLDRLQRRLHVHRQTRESQHRPTTARNPAPWFLEWGGMVLTVSKGSEISLW